MRICNVWKLQGIGEPLAKAWHVGKNSVRILMRTDVKVIGREETKEKRLTCFRFHGATGVVI